MHRLAVIGALLLLAGCAQQNPLLVGSVSGTVVASPCRPVERAGDPPCPPVPDVQVDFTDSQSHTFSARTGTDGRYTISLQPGDYYARVRAGFRSRPQAVTVVAGQSIELDLTYDSGIR
jgi:type 1 fimbria pilin